MTQTAPDTAVPKRPKKRRGPSGPHCNGGGAFSPPPNGETTAETFDRLEKSQAAGWKGSVSIHGHMR